MMELDEYMKDRIENIIATKMTEARAPGLSLAIVKDNQVIYTRGFGSRNLKENLPATPDTLYGIGFLYKVFYCFSYYAISGIWETQRK